MKLESDLAQADVNLGLMAEQFRSGVSRELNPSSRAKLGQFLTPLSVAEFMASLFQNKTKNISLLDPGAGVGTLTAAFVQSVIEQGWPTTELHSTTVEVDVVMRHYLSSCLELCDKMCATKEIDFSSSIISDDFIFYGVEHLQDVGSLFERDIQQFTHCIANPPYRKINSNSQHRAELRQIGIETSNLYSAFLAIAIKLLAPGGELVAIIPRSFCNGAYFRSFRKQLLSELKINQLHVFGRRDQAFKEDDVLQENIILYATKQTMQGEVTITSSSDATFDDMTERVVSFDMVVKPNDPDQYIHVVTSDSDQLVVDRVATFNCTLEELGLDVSTGPVVDFRLRSEIAADTENGCAALIYPSHFANGFVEWPKPSGKKPNAIRDNKKSRRWLMPNGWYVLTRRFSSKEERRRIVAALHEPDRVASTRVGFENHLNVFHCNKKGLSPNVAKGLALYLNSSIVDMYFRQFSGHTQVNATDLRMLHYPSRSTLEQLGKHVGDVFPDQPMIDKLMEGIMSDMAEQDAANPVEMRTKIDGALQILASLGFPRAQRNERSALALLALLGLKPGDAWQEAGKPLMGITPIMEFVIYYYGSNYKPNTRETFRRQTVHQFMDAGLAIQNPDLPERPVNSPKTVYQIEPEALDLIRTYGSNEWEQRLRQYLEVRPTLAERYAQERDMRMIPLALQDSSKLFLSSGEHSELIKDIIEKFGPRFAPGAEVLYVGDTGSKFGHFDQQTFSELNLSFDSHGKFPDVVLYMRPKNWLFLVEAVTSHGPVDAKRHNELTSLFEGSTADLIYVTAFPTRAAMSRYVTEIGWETEVWIADSPTHLIHFDGERFLGPYSY